MININWVELVTKRSKVIEMSLCDEKFIIHYVGNTIIKTEWHLEQFDEITDKPRQWQIVKSYINNPIGPLTVNLKIQGSEYRHKVWAEMCKIPVGEVLTYSELAKRIGSGARAVAGACRDNPFPGIIPCHRVVAVTGVGGFMGQTSGRALELKCKLLALEAISLRQSYGNY